MGYLEGTMRFIVRALQLVFYASFLTLVGPTTPGARRNAGPV
jgi:hypothetical protein